MSSPITIAPASVDDAKAIWRIVTDSGILDVNSGYMYMLLCKEFSSTCVVARESEQVIGFVTGFIKPTAPDTLFLWQVGVHEAGRGKGLGKKLVSGFLRAPGASGISYLETTVSPSNTASCSLFKAIARDLGTDMKVSPYFTADQFPASGHEDEELFRIGPLSADKIKSLTY